MVALSPNAHPRSPAMPAVHSLPEPLIRSYVAGLARDADAVERWQGLACGAALRKVIADLVGMLENPIYRWITPDETAVIMRCSAETIRRHCRDQTATFLFQQDEKSGRYNIWLPSIPEAGADLSTAPRDSQANGDEP